jgi:hypothetical protein
MNCNNGYCCEEEGKFYLGKRTTTCLRIIAHISKWGIIKHDVNKFIGAFGNV